VDITLSIKLKLCLRIWIRANKLWKISKLNYRVELEIMDLLKELNSTQRSSHQVIGHFKKFQSVLCQGKWERLKKSSVNFMLKSSKTEKLFGFTTMVSYWFKQITFKRNTKCMLTASKLQSYAYSTKMMSWLFKIFWIDVK